MASRSWLFPVRYALCAPNAFAADHHIGLCGAETFGKLELWYGYVIEAIGGTAIVTHKMNMVVVVMTRAAFVLA